MILKISVRLLKHLTSRRMILLLERPDSGKSTLLLALADKSLKLTESAQPKPTELFWVSSVRPTTCLGEHQQTATCLKNLKAFAEAIDVVRDKGVAMAVAVVVIVAVASAEDIDAANGARPNFFRGEESSLN
ncbi:unnamed protein product [Brassica rapa]|uniref:Uncharacterized protein n=1 Tax=Brassica campestris TaxID=3711 RepID=A0A8D9I0I7_BRACM|nr:unnamed protein product [Brassica rapa]